MDIIKRNFFCLLRYGAFNEYEPVEKMSAYKWGCSSAWRKPTMLRP